jgi:RHS repeat-associated protein
MCRVLADVKGAMVGKRRVVRTVAVGLCGALIMSGGLAPAAAAAPADSEGAGVGQAAGAAWSAVTSLAGTVLDWASGAFEPDSDEDFDDDRATDGADEQAVDAGAALARDEEPLAGEQREPAERAREVVSERTANAKVFELEDGQFEAEFHADPIHYLDDDGNWAEIDTTVGNSAREGFARGVTKNSFDSWFGERSDRLVRFQLGNRHVTLGLDGDRRSLDPEIDGNTVTYAGAFENADVVYTVGSAGLKEEIVLHEPPQDNEFSFTVQMGGVEAREREDNSIGFYPIGGGDDDVPVFEIPAPFMFDDADDPESPNGKVWSNDVTQEVSQRGANATVTLTADEEWLADPDRVYPVVVDPTIKIVPNPAAAQNAMVLETSPNNNYGDDPRLSVGTTNTGRARSYLKFDLSSIPAGTRIDSAVMRLYYDQVHTNNNHNVEIGAYRILEPWEQSTLTWNNKPSTNSGTTYSRTVVDNGDPGSSQVGSWPYSTNTTLTQLAWNYDYQFSQNSHANDSYTWVPNLHEAGTYEVDAHYVRAGDRTTVPYTVHHANGTASRQVNQSAGSGGVWAPLGAYHFEPGTDHQVVLGGVADASKAVIADAVRFTRYATDVKGAGETSRWHEFSVTATVQLWLNGGAPNYGFMLRATDETLSQGGPRYQASQYAYGGGVENRPALVVRYGNPGVELDPVYKTYSTGAELHWSEYEGDDIAEYQVHRTQSANFDPSAQTLVAPVPADRTTFTDTTATPTPADDPDPFGAYYYYMVVVKTTSGELIPAPTRLARLPKAGRVRHVFQAEVEDTSLSQARPNENLNTITGSPWLMAGNNSATYGVTRPVIKFPGVEDEIPDDATVVGGQLQLWTAHSFGGGASFNAHVLTEGFDETSATWNHSAAGQSWSSAGGTFNSQVAGSVAAIPNEPYWHRFSVASAVQGWASGEVDNHGFLVKLADESGPQQRVLFLSSEAEEPSRHPMLVVTYLEATAESTYYAPEPAVRTEAGEERTVEVTVTNTTDETWSADDMVLSYRWEAPDGTDVTTAANRAETSLPEDLVPGESVTVEATVLSPELEEESNKREAFTIQWDMRSKGSGQWMSQLRNIPALDQSAIVEDVTSNQIGLEKFYQYAGKNTGAGSTLMNNLHAGNAVWSYNAFSNPSRGVASFARFTYNSLDTSASSMGYGWSLATSSLMRLGTPLDLHPRGQDWPSQVTLTDGDGTAHLFRLDKNGSDNPEDWEYLSPRGVNLYLQKTGAADSTRAWVFTAPDRTQFYFDADGYQSALVDNNGNELVFTYENKRSNNQPIKFLRYVTDPDGRQTLTLDYFRRGEPYVYVDENGQVQSGDRLTNPKIVDQVRSITDISGRTVELAYTEEGLLAQLTDGAGDAEEKVFGFAYDAQQGNKNVKLVEVTDPRGNSTELSYFEATTDPKAKWLLASLTDRAGGVTTFDYVDLDGPHGGWIQTTVTDAHDNASVYVMDGFGRPVSMTDAHDETTELAWDDNHNVVELTEANGAVTSWEYDAKTGYPTAIVDAQANADGTPGTELAYQRSLNGYVADLTGRVSPEGRDWTFDYDVAGNLTSVTDPAGNETTYAYDSSGQLVEATDANGNATGYDEYGPTGFPALITDALGNDTEFVYDVRGNVTSITDAAEKTASFGWDVFGRPGEQQVPKDADNDVFIVTPAPVYDANDNITVATAPNGAVTEYEYDVADQMVSRSDPVDAEGDPDRVSTFEWDLVGNLVATTEPLGNLPDAGTGDFTTTYTYDALSQLVTVTNAEGHEISYEFDSVGNLVAVTDPRGGQTTYEYDLAHRPLSTTDAAGESTSTEYDLDGLVVASTDQEGATTRLELDERGHVVEVAVPHDDGVDRVTRFEYDAVGNRVKTITPRAVEAGSDAAFVHETVFDELNRVIEQVYPFDPDDPVFNTPDSVSYSYDVVGNLAEVVAPPSDGQDVPNSISYEFFDNGWMASQVDAWGIATLYDYNELGQQVLRTHTSAGGTERLMSWSYLPDGKLAGRGDDGTPPGEHVVLVDDSDFQNVTTEGSWSTASSVDGFHGLGYQWTGAGDGSRTFTWRLHVPADGDYEVFVRYVTASNRATNAPYTISHDDGDSTVLVDQNTDGGQWVSVGEFGFTEGGDHQIELSNDADGRVVADAVRLVRDTSGETDTHGKEFTYSYDANGNLIQVDDSSSDAAVDAYRMSYTGLNQIENVEELVDGSVDKSTAFAYDEAGNPLTREHDDAYAEYVYDVRNLVTEVTNADEPGDTDPKVTTFAYTPRGQTERETKANENTVDYAYFLDGLLKHQVEKTAAGVVVNEHTITYTANGHRETDLARTQNADDASDYLEHLFSYSYDPRDRVAEVVKATLGGTVLDTETYRHDAASNVINQTVGGVSTTFTYDRNRLLTATVGGVAATYNYDPFGRLDTITSAGQVVEQYRYDSFDRLVEQRSLDSDGASETTSFGYDAFDRTTSRTDADGEQTDFSYLGLSGEVLSEEIAGEVQTSYQYSPWGQRLSQVKHGTGTGGADESSFYGYNPHTDVEVLTGEDGQSIATYGYTAYGKDDEDRFTGVDAPDAGDPTDGGPYNVYRFNAKRFDHGSGTYDMGFRHYNPGLNRFLSRDMYTGGLADLNLTTSPWTNNRYAFAGGNPITNVELDGHMFTPYGGTGAVTSETTAEDEAVAAAQDAMAELWQAQERGDPLPDCGTPVQCNADLIHYDDVFWPFLGDVTGVSDGVDCGANQDGGACVWTAAGFVPVLGWAKRIGGAVKNLVRKGDDVADAAKAGRGVLRSVDDVMADGGTLLRGKSPAEVESILKGTPGWRVEGLGQGSAQGRGWMMREYTERGHPTGRMIRWHPGGGHHGPDPYWRVGGYEGDLFGIIR